MTAEKKPADPHGWQREIEEAFAFDGVIGGAYLSELIELEREAGAAFVGQYAGHRVLTDAFFDFFSGTLTNVTDLVRQVGWPPNTSHYSIALTMLFTALRSARAAELMSLHGYMYQGYSQLRSVKDQAFVLSAAANGMVSLDELFGAKALSVFAEGTTRDEKSKAIVKARWDAEKRVVKFLMNTDLSESTRYEMERWDRLFNWEAHRGLFTFYHDLQRVVERNPIALSLSPVTDGYASAMFMNRSFEVSWLLLRILPVLQVPPLEFTQDWIEKWHLLDRSFRLMAESLGDIGKKIGPAFIEFIDRKFMFSPTTPSFLLNYPE